MTKRSHIWTLAVLALTLALGLAIFAFTRSRDHSHLPLARSSVQWAGSFDHSHAAFDAVLKRYVKDASVDYAGIKAHPGELNRYLDQVAAVPRTEFQKWSEPQQIAFLSNAYNAYTIWLIVEYYPLKSIMDIPADDRWDSVEWTIGGKTYSLNQIEHEQIRPNFKEPRIHFAVVCAAVGCPPPRNEAYDAKRIEEQLQDQSEYVHNHGTWFQFDAAKPKLKLTKLYKWYGGDFEQASESAAKYAAQFSEGLRLAMDSEQPPSPEWLPYDWTLNSKDNKAQR